MKTRMKRIVAAGVLAALLPAFTMYAQKDTTVTAGTWKYTGEYPVGEGTLYSYEEGLISGHFVECVAEGPGIQYLPDGSRYQGNFSGGRRSGHGQLFSASGDIITGNFKDGQADGRDTLVTSSGTVFIGVMKDGRPTKDGTKYPSASSAGIKIPEFKPTGPDKEQKKFLKEIMNSRPASGIDDRKATYKGGNFSKFYREWMQPRLKWPKNSEGDESFVEFCFTINTDGTLTDIRIIRCMDKRFGDTVVKTLSKAPEWEPAVKNGQFVPQTFMQRINFIQDR